MDFTLDEISSEKEVIVQKPVGNRTNPAASLQLTAQNKLIPK